MKSRVHIRFAVLRRSTTMSSEYNNKLNSSDCLDCTETPAGEYIHQQRKNFSLFTCDLYSFALHIIQTTHTCASLLRSPSFVGRCVFVFIMQMFARTNTHSNETKELSNARKPCGVISLC